MGNYTVRVERGEGQSLGARLDTLWMRVRLVSDEVQRALRHRGPSERASASGTWRLTPSWYAKGKNNGDRDE